MSESDSVQEMTLIRMYDAPRERVFEAWTDPELLARWWGPDDYITPVCELDVRPGGDILIHMQGPDGTVMPVNDKYHEVIEPERLVFTTGVFFGEDGVAQVEEKKTVEFIEHRNQGDSAYLYGISSGGALALEAANRISAIRKLAIYEVPYIVDNSRAPLPPDYLEKLTRLVESDQRGAALKLFMRTGVGMPAILVAMLQLMPGWSKMKSIAHTLINDTTFMVDLQKGNPLPADRWASLTMPALIIDGGKSPSWVRNAARTLAETLPNASYRTLERQTHIVKPAALAPVLMDFFKQ